MGLKSKGFYAILLAITVFCSSTLAYATDNHLLSKGKDQRTTILAGPDTHDVTFTVIYTLNADQTVTANVQFPQKFVTHEQTITNVPEICPEDFAVIRNEPPNVNYERQYKYQGIFDKTYKQLLQPGTKNKQRHEDPGSQLQFLNI